MLKIMNFFLSPDIVFLKRIHLGLSRGFVYCHIDRQPISFLRPKLLRLLSKITQSSTLFGYTCPKIVTLTSPSFVLKNGNGILCFVLTTKGYKFLKSEYRILKLSDNSKKIRRRYGKLIYVNYKYGRALWVLFCFVFRFLPKQFIGL